MDLASASYDDDKIAWHRNVNGDGSSCRLVGDDARLRRGNDGDGHMDLASEGLNDDKIARGAM